MKRPFRTRVRRAVCWTICWAPAIALYKAQLVFPRARRLNRAMCAVGLALQRLGDRILYGGR